MGKKALCLIFAFLLSIESMAAVVSDNDGAAFVTKKEFESLKDSFAKQIDNYQQSLDLKLDGAVAAYLSGMKLGTKEEMRPEYSGRKFLVCNLQKIDKLKFGKMNFTIVGGALNIDRDVANNWALDGLPKSSGMGFIMLERKDADVGEGFEVFRVDDKNNLYYYDDLRFYFTATKFASGRTSSGGSTPATQLKVRWHAWYQDKATSNGNNPCTEGNGAQFCDLLSDIDWLTYHQTEGIGVLNTRFIQRDSGYSFAQYVTGVETTDKGTPYLISTDGIDGLSSNILCCFTSNQWSTDLITQQESLYNYYDTTTYKYSLPSDAGLTGQTAHSWTINDWGYYNNPTATARYHNSAASPTWFEDCIWVTGGRYNRSETEAPNTSGEFYEMIPRLFSKNLNTLKNETAIKFVKGEYTGWDGYLYNGIPLYNFDRPGTVEFTLDLSDADEDLYLAIKPVPFSKTQSVSSLVNTKISAPIVKWFLDGVEKDKTVVTLTKGSSHKISIEFDEKTPIYYKLVPTDANSKKKNIITFPDTMIYTSES